MPAKPLPNTGAVSGLKETLDFFSDPSFAQRRFETVSYTHLTLPTNREV